MPFARTNRRPYPEETVIADLGNIGKYKTRILETAKGPALDVREFIAGDGDGGFEGFTRKGIRLDTANASALGQLILTAIAEGKL